MLAMLMDIKSTPLAARRAPCPALQSFAQSGLDDVKHHLDLRFSIAIDTAIIRFAYFERLAY